MASDIQQPFSLSFEVDALHSSSISFGRFELESLSWERKSSFSHNRYLEEVEKYAKPGSVTEKKAYFEAHFRNRALLRQASSASQAKRDGKNSDSGSYSTSTCDESPRDLIQVQEIRHIVENDNVCRLDDSLKSSSRDEDFSVFEYEAGLSQNLHSESSFEYNTDSINDLDKSLKCSSSAGDFCGGEHEGNARATDRLELKPELAMDTRDHLVENVKFYDNVETRGNDSTNDQVLMVNVPQSIRLESQSDDQAPDVQEEQCISGCIASKTLKASDENISSGPGSRPDAHMSLTCEVKKGIARTKGWREKKTPLRARAQKQVPDSIAPSLQSSLRQLTENPQSLKQKSSQGNRSEKEMRPKRAVTPQPSTPERSESRRHRSATSTVRQIVSTTKEIGQSGINFSIKSSGGAEKKREKIMAANGRQLSGKSDVKEKQNHCPVSNAVPRLLNRQKSQVVSSSQSSAKAPSGNFQPENRMTARSNPCPAPKVKQAISVTKSVMGRGTGVHKALDKVDLPRIRRRLLEVDQRKEVVRMKEVAGERKPKARENDQTANRKLIETTNKDGLGRRGHHFLRKSIGDSSGASHHAVASQTTPNVGSGRIGNGFLRKRMGH